MNNLNNTHLTEEQIATVNEAISNLENALKTLNTSLSPEERSKYGRVNEQNKLFVNKVNDFAKSQPELRSPDVDWEEFERDFNSRKFYENSINRLDNLLLVLKNHKILADYDNHQDALTDYAYTSYKVGSRAANFEDKHRDLKQFFTKGRLPKAEDGEA